MRGNHACARFGFGSYDRRQLDKGGLEMVESSESPGNAPDETGGSVERGNGSAEGIHSLICGLSGWGKSYYLAWILRQRKRWILWIPWGRGFEKIGVHVKSYSDLLKYWKENKDKPTCRVVYYPPLYDTELCYDLLEDFSKRLFREGDNIIFALDEAQRYRAVTAGGTKGDYPKSYYMLQDEGRHHGISTIQAVRRPVQTPPESRGLADECVSFHLNSGNDLRILEDYFGDEVDKIRHLPKYHFLKYTAGEEITENGPV